MNRLSTAKRVAVISALVEGCSVRSTSRLTEVWRQVLFAPVTTTKIRIYVTNALLNWTRIVEVEAFAP